METRRPSRHKTAVSRSQQATCDICHKKKARHELVPFPGVRPNISDLIRADDAEWGEGRFICREDLATYRRKYVESLLEDERGELTRLDEEVLDTIERHEIITRQPGERVDEAMSFGERMADRVATFGGSWTFILTFVLMITAWIVLNVTGWLFKPVDQYPFILLNLLLSCVAAVQAPIIMMSQQRQEQKDRLRAENDYKINLKAELEIRLLHEKIDHQIAHQWQRLAEMQEIQLELLEDRGKPPPR